MPSLNSGHALACPAPSTNVPPELIEQIKTAVADEALAEQAEKEAQREANTAMEVFHTRVGQREHRTQALAKLLLEAKEFTVPETFEKFALEHFGLKKSRVNELLRIARGDLSAEETKKRANARLKKHRANKKTKPATATVSPSHETVKAEDEVPASAEREIVPAFHPIRCPCPLCEGDHTELPPAVSNEPVAAKADKESARNLDEFKVAARIRLNKLNAADLEIARAFVAGDGWKTKAP